MEVVPFVEDFFRAGALGTQSEFLRLSGPLPDLIARAREVDRAADEMPAVSDPTNSPIALRSASTASECEARTSGQELQGMSASVRHQSPQDLYFVSTEVLLSIHVPSPVGCLW